MPETSTQGEQEVHAFTHHIGPFVVFFHSIPPAELTQGQPPTSSVGTGFLVQLRGRKYLVSALHCFFYEECGLSGVIRTWESTRFKFRGKQPVNLTDGQTTYPPVRVTLDTGVTLSQSFPAGLLIDREHDLIAVEVDGSLEQFANAEFIDLEKDAFTGNLQHDASLLTLGNPFDGRIPIPGNATRSALIPHLDHTQFDANLDTSWSVMKYLRPDYFFVPYSLEQDKVAPYGFSGAPVFTQGGSDAETVWIVTPRVLGVALRYFDGRETMVAVKIQVVIDLLETA